MRSFVWNGADRLVQRGADSFNYDALGRMTASTIAGVPAPVTRTYAYDGDGLLRSRTEGGATTSYLWDAASAPAPLLVAGSDRVVHGLGPLYLARANGSTLTLVRDALGSVRAEVNEQGALTKAFRYAAYGEIVQPNANTPTLLGFAGQLRDPSGLVYLRARWYDPGTGRFMSRDAFTGLMHRPTTLNGYTYGDANPVRFVDPSGFDPVVTIASPRAVAELQTTGPADQMATGRDYQKISITVFIFTVDMLKDRYGQEYYAFGLGTGLPPVSASITDGLLKDPTRHSRQDIRDFITGPTATFQGGIGPWGQGVTISPSVNNSANESGLYTPQASVSVTWGFTRRDVESWSPWPPWPLR